MKGNPLILVGLILTLALFSAWSDAGRAAEAQPAATAAADSATASGKAQPALPSSPLMFIENVGQFAEDPRFKVHGSDRAFWLADDALWITIMEPASPTDIRDLFAADPLMQPAEQPETPGRGVNLRITFPGSNPDAELSAYGPVETTISYFLGNDPEKWRPDVPVWAGVQYRDLYPGLDLVWDSAGERPGLRLICRATHCAAALADVQLRVEGADALNLEGDGLLIETAAGDFRLPLLAVADAAGRPLRLAGLSPRLHGDSITVPYAAHAAALPIPAMPADEPEDLLYSTFLGGSGEDAGDSLALDAAGNATVTGYTQSSNFPTTPGAFEGSYSGYTDIFVSRLNSAGNARLYSTFLGGSDEDYGYSLALDAANNITLTGITGSSDFPTTRGAFDGSYSGYTDIFVSRLNSAGNALLYSTFLGGSSWDYGYSLALDAGGNATLTGWTESADFPTTHGAFDTSYNGFDDVFVARLNASGSALLYSTYLGGSHDEVGYSLVLDAAGKATLTGYTRSADFPATFDAFDIGLDGENDVFVSRLNAAGSALLYSTFLGGADVERGYSIALDAAGNAVLTGSTGSADFPTTPGAFDSSYNGRIDVFVSRLNAAGGALLYSTFLGGSDREGGYSLALDAAGIAGGNVVALTGETDSADFPTTPGALDRSYNGETDVFVSRLNVAGNALLYSTFLGGSSWDEGYDLARDTAGNARGAVATLTGETDSADFPTTPGAFDGSHNGDGDVFFATVALVPIVFSMTVYLPVMLR